MDSSPAKLPWLSPQRSAAPGGAATVRLTGPGPLHILRPSTKCSSRRSCHPERIPVVGGDLVGPSTKCSSRRSCHRSTGRAGSGWSGALNEVQLPEELPHESLGALAAHRCGPQRSAAPGGAATGPAPRQRRPPCRTLNEVQLPEELPHGQGARLGHGQGPSTKCSSRRSCHTAALGRARRRGRSLNEVQLPDELPPWGVSGRILGGGGSLNEVQLPEELPPAHRTA